MNLARALRLIPFTSLHNHAGGSGLIRRDGSRENPRVIAFVGAGGKTTAIFHLARSLNSTNGKPVIITATSHLAAWQFQLADHHQIVITTKDLDDLPISGITLVTGELDGDRSLPISSEFLLRLRDLCNVQGMVLLIEADGSRGRPLKAPGNHEPPIPDFTDIVVVVAGLSGLDQRLTDHAVHRPECFSALSELRDGDLITSDALVRVLLHGEGGLKNIPPTALRVALLNQADTTELQSAGGRMALRLLQGYDSILVGSLHNETFQTVENTAGIILAAGESSRFGQPKPLLDWRGQPFVRSISRTALEAGLNPVAVVSGANADQVEVALNDLPIIALRNSEWSEGQASSIRTGIGFLGNRKASEGSRTVGSAIFLLVDQPQVTVSILEALKAAHTVDLQPIIAPLVLEQRANPVLFDRITFKDLMQLHGDIGGRGIFDRHQIEYLPWHDDRLLLDVDTPEQYARLIHDDIH